MTSLPARTQQKNTAFNNFSVVGVAWGDVFLSDDPMPTNW
jgi:hypothetical protein